MHRRIVLTLSLLAAVALCACGQARKSESASAETARCTRCHGGTDNQTGAPPGALRGEGKDGSTAAMSVGAHSAHVQAGKLAAPFACTACHPDPRAGSTHLDGKVELALDGFAHEPATTGPPPAFDAGTGTCAVYCHGAFRGGNGGNTPIWNRVGQGQAACGSCHAAPPPAPHPASADCGRCHAGYTAGSVNLATHVNGRIDLDGLACTSCHGDPARAKSSAAPPMGTRGETATTERAVGAHQAHLNGASLGTTVACDDCHEVPASLTHANGSAELRFGPRATAGGTFSAGFDGTSCATYCHGATLAAGGTNTAPRWTGGSGEVSCGSCHGVPPPAPHPAVAGLNQCAVCHPQTMNSSGALIPASAGGKHLDGTLQSSGHGDGWMEPASPGFHAFSANADLASCTTCHGAQLDGGSVNVACARCHNFFPEVVPDWRRNCVMCHGKDDNRTGAPPRTTWGRNGDAVRVGAHTTHLSGSAIAPAFDCGECHVRPVDALSAGHVDGATATVTFGGLATVGTAVPPTWDRASATCASTYCHGGTLRDGTNTRPKWTDVGTGEASCGSCHGVPPGSPHPAVTGGLASCAGCHPDTMDSAGRIIPPASGGKHLDGALEVAGGHEASWMDKTSAGFHAYAAAAGLASCQACHGPKLDALAGGNCANCHGGSSWPTRCTMCHGGTDNQSGAPPKTTYGKGGDAVRVGAHTAHVTGGPMAPPFDCGVCHVKPADAFAAVHLDGATATVTFGGVAVPTGSSAVPVWNRSSATCASTYCHGATLAGGSNTAPVWTGGASQATCGSCHGTPPPAPHPAVSSNLGGCAGCHGSTVDGAGQLIPPASGGKHLNGVVDAGSLAAGCASCHGLPPGDGGRNGHVAHSQLRLDCAACHAGYTRSSADPAFHMNGRRDARFTYTTPNPDPGPGIPPTLAACETWTYAIAEIPPSTNPTVWDFNLCTTCHNARDYRYNRCCVEAGAPSPEWCSYYW